MAKMKKNENEKKAKKEMPNEEMKEEVLKECDEEAQNEAEENDEKQNDEEKWNDKYLRLMADFQNFKRRIETEKSDIYARANERIIGDLLNVIDNFDRALKSAGDSNDAKFVEGIELILKQLKGVLDKEGVEEIASLGEDFDPNFHNAVMTEESGEYESGKVSEVLQKGYTLRGKVLRPSMVKVVK